MSTISAPRSDSFSDSLEVEEGQLSSRVLSTDEERKLLKEFWTTKKARGEAVKRSIEGAYDGRGAQESSCICQIHLDTDESPSLA